METQANSKHSSNTSMIKDCFHCGNPTDRVYCPVCDFELTKSAGNARVAKLPKAAQLVGVPAHLCDVELTKNDKSRVKDWKAGTGLLIFGPDGAGKSRLAAALTLDRLDRVARIVPHHVTKWWSQVCYVRAPVLLSRVRAGIRERDDYPLKQFTDPTFLVVDDFGYDNPSDWVSEQWLSLFDARNHKRISTVICSAFNSKDIEKMYGAPVANRLRQFERVALRGKNAS